MFTKKFPNEVSDLLKHAENVRQIDRDGGYWAYYDNGFRKLRQVALTPWATFHSELAHKALYSEKRSTSLPRSGGSNRHSFRAIQSNARPTVSHPKGTCFRYHTAKIRCEGACNYPHACYKCDDGPHPVYRCLQKGGNNPSTTGKANSANPSAAANSSKSR